MEIASTVNQYSFLTGGGEMGELTRQYDWSSTSIGTPDQWPQSLRVTLSIILNARFPMFLWWGPELIQFYNDAYRPSLGNNGKHPTALGQCGEECWPETWPIIKPLIDQVLSGGEAVWSEDQLVPIYRNNQLEDAYWTFSYSPVKDESGKIAGVLVTCTETTKAVLKRRESDESQRQVLDFFEQSPVAIAIISEDNLTFRMANSFYGHLVGREPDELIGKPLLEALPELQGQGFDTLLREVIATGTPFIANEVAVDIVRNNQLETIYVDLTYQPRRETSSGSVTGILVVATDVTQQVRARQKVEESEARFRLLIEQAPVATCLFVGREMRIDVANELMINFWGKGWSVIGKPLSEAVPEMQGQPFLEILDEVYTTGIPYTARSMQADLEIDGVLGSYYFDFTYKPIRNAAGEVYAIMDMAVDVTDQVTDRKALEESEARYRQLSTELDEQVQERTRQLQVSVQDLQRSNQNLQQFAYIASHDLQEPLRKIQQFGDLLKTRYAPASGDELIYLDRMQSAASRMSTLIRDLLSFSRISTQRDTSKAVSLNEVVNTVLTDLELTITEIGADIHVDTLPTVSGDPLQLGQLFQNLVSNALKFRRPTITPIIQINTHRLEASALPSSVKPVRMTKAYHRIDVADNGIGFNEKYLDRIFQVFQRLHSKSEFAGTGIGLAICEKVVTNHGGAITATSQPGCGATFSVYLPI